MAHRFEWDAGSGWMAYRVESILRQYGTHAAGRRTNGSLRSFTVPDDQAIWAEYLLLRAGVPLESQPLDTRNASHAQRLQGAAMPEPWMAGRMQTRGIVERIGDLFAGLFGATPYPTRARTRKERY